MRNRSAGKFIGKEKSRSIYSPGYYGTRVPEGRSGAQRPLLSAAELELFEAPPTGAQIHALTFSERLPVLPRGFRGRKGGRATTWTDSSNWPFQSQNARVRGT